MSYVIEQKIKGNVYLYEVESYWDPQKKQARQRRKYLGKKDPDTQSVITPRKMPVVSSSVEYGGIYLLKQIAVRIGLTHAVHTSFGSKWAESLMSLAYFQILEAKPWYLYPLWCEDLKGVVSLSSQKISTLLYEIGSNDTFVSQFFHHWASHQKPLKGVWLDITSVSSYSQQNNWVEWGYNRDHDVLPQVNLGILMGGTSQLPFFYQLYPGSIADVSTLHNIARRARDLEFDIQTWVMDRGFFSLSNVEDLVAHGYHFITAMPATLKIAHRLLADSQIPLRSPVKSFCLGKEVLFTYDTTCTLGTLSLRACVYLSEKRRTQEIETFVRKLEALEQQALSMTFENLENAQDWMNRQFKGSSQFYTLSLKDHSLVLKRKRNALSFRMNRMGKMILLTNRLDMTPKDLLNQYRSRDRVEKVYDTLKNSLHEDRLRTHGPSTMHGKMFVTFLALILHTELTNTLYVSPLSKTYSLPEILMELRKIKLFSRSLQQPSFLSEISKKQRSIFDAFNLKLPSLSSLLTS